MGDYDDLTNTKALLQESDHPKLLCRGIFLRPLPQGRRIYCILLQLLLLNFVGEVIQIFFQFFLARHLKAEPLPTYIIPFSISYMLCLPMGFIADRYFGRAKVLYYSWILLFVAQLTFSVYFVVASFIFNESLHIVSYILLIPAFLIHSFGMAGVRVNLIPFGVDQMRTASSDELSSYFHWYYWCRNVGYLLAYSVGASFVVTSKYELIALLISSAAATIGVVINILGYNWFIKREKIGNPLLLIYGVLRYAVTANRPAERSAFSFDGRPKPSRIDLAKQTHYGIYRDEKVEDVKTFLRILVFLVSLIGFLCVYSLLGNVYIQQAAYFQQPKQFFTEETIKCPPGCNISEVTIHQLHSFYSLNWTLLFNILAVFIIIPILDRVVYPLCYPRMLTRLGVGVVVCLSSVICALSIEAVCYHNFLSQSEPHVNVFHYIQMFSVTIPIWVIAPQFIIQGLAECLVFITMVEFIYAQSPAYMKGLLLGCLFFIQGLAMTLGSLLVFSQLYGHSKYWEYFKLVPSGSDQWCRVKEVDSGSGLAAYVSTAIIIILGIVLFLYSARKYKIRI